MNLSKPIWTENGAVNLTKSGSHTLYTGADVSLLSNTFRKASRCALIHHTSTHIHKLLCVPFLTFMRLPVHILAIWSCQPSLLAQQQRRFQEASF